MISTPTPKHSLLCPGALALGVLLPSPAVAQQTMYTTQGVNLVARDPATGTEKWTTSAFYLGQTWGLAFDGSRLTALDVTGWNPVNETIRIHPADLSMQSLGTTGYKWSNLAGFDVDPTTGQIYVTADTEIYKLDGTTGSLIHYAGLSGMKNGDCVCSLAIDDQGVGYGSGLLGSPSLYQIDLATGSVTDLGVIEPLSVGTGKFYDLDFDSSGQLWGAYAGGFGMSGIYKIDISSVTGERIVWGNLGISGLAFGPATPETLYCTPKTSSAGCLPSIRSTGVASPTASFGYEVHADGVPNSSYGMLVYSTLGSGGTAFAGATLCVTSPWMRTKIVHSGGSPPGAQDCTGSWSFDMNTHLTNKPGPAPGDTLWCQWLGRDPGFPQGQNYALSDALEFTLLP